MASLVYEREIGGDDNDDDDGGVAQHGSHTPNNRLTKTNVQPWFTVYFFDIGQPCYPLIDTC